MALVAAYDLADGLSLGVAVGGKTDAILLISSDRYVKLSGHNGSRSDYHLTDKKTTFVGA